ncbi:MAG TPA: NAD(P)H-binding protein, partial [Gaiellales bacterium]|nr:NAD(P)H-binding protein [Gaiellales bacterium]
MAETIVITGATGNVGRELVALLAGTGVAVRAVTRDPAAAEFPAGVDAVRADLLDPATLDDAFAGA